MSSLGLLLGKARAARGCHAHLAGHAYCACAVCIGKVRTFGICGEPRAVSPSTPALGPEAKCPALEFLGDDINGERIWEQDRAASVRGVGVPAGREPRVVPYNFSVELLASRRTLHGTKE